MATKIDKCHRKVNDAFRECLQTAFKKRFDLALTTTFSIFSMAMVSSREDEKNLTDEQRDFIASYEYGYADAMNLVSEF